jgi:hypothetical protein
MDRRITPADVGIQIGAPAGGLMLLVVAGFTPEEAERKLDELLLEAFESKALELQRKLGVSV